MSDEQLLYFDRRLVLFDRRHLDIERRLFDIDRGLFDIDWGERRNRRERRRDDERVVLLHDEHRRDVDILDGSDHFGVDDERRRGWRFRRLPMFDHDSGGWVKREQQLVELVFVFLEHGGDDRFRRVGRRTAGRRSSVG